MKAKIYPLLQISDRFEAYADPFCLQLEIICASLAKGSTIIKNICSSKDIDTTILWCKTLGANIKKSNDKLIIKGINNKIKFQNSLFVCPGNSSTTAKLMIPLLCTVQQPFGIKANENILNELKQYKELFESYGVDFFVEKDIIRFEKIIKTCEKEIDGDIDINLAAGFFIAFPLLKGSSTLKLIAPVRSEKTYSTILKILKKFHIDIKHPATMRYDINGFQSYRKCKIKTETDKFILSNFSLLTQRLEMNHQIKIYNYHHGSTGDLNRLYDFIKKNVVIHTNHIKDRTIKKKTLEIHKMELIVENSLPLLMVIASLCNNDCIISKVNFNKERIKKQYNIMSNIFTKLNIDHSALENEIVISHCNVLKKMQIDCQNDPYVAIAISMLAMLSEVPIIIKNADCIYDLYLDYFNTLKKLGAIVEFIHN